MKFLTVGVFLVGAVSGVAADYLIPGARIIPDKDTSALRSIGAHRQKYPDRRTVTIRPSKNDTDDVSTDFLWGIKQANHGGRLLLQKGKTYIIGKKLDLSFLNNIEVQLEGEIKVRGTVSHEDIEADRNSLPTTLDIGRPITSTMISKNPSRSGFGVDRISRSLARAR